MERAKDIHTGRHTQGPLTRARRKWIAAIEGYFERQRHSVENEWTVVIVASRINGSYVEYETLATHTPTRTQCRSIHRYSGLLKVRGGARVPAVTRSSLLTCAPTTAARNLAAAIPGPDERHPLPAQKGLACLSAARTIV
jgi:hypothetical protein